MDVVLNSATAPYLIIPLPAGYALGWLSRLGASTQLQLMAAFLPGIQMMSTMIVMFLIRQQAIMPDGHQLKFSTRTAHIIYAAIPTLFCLQIWGVMIYMLVCDDQPAAKKLYEEKYPFFRRFFDIPSLYVFSPEIGGMVIMNLSIFVFITIGTIAGKFSVLSVAGRANGGSICTVCFIVLTGQKQFMSLKTYRLQKLWVYNCIIQVTVPMVTLVGPIGLDMYIYFADDIALVGFLPFIIAMGGQHGFCSSIVTLLIYKPYSEYVKKSTLSVIAFIKPHGAFGRPATSVRATSATINRSLTATISYTVNPPMKRR
ncbi:unnamed protein product, partial [Mesorhabditis spiculigera]